MPTMAVAADRRGARGLRGAGPRRPASSGQVDRLTISGSATDRADALEGGPALVEPVGLEDQGVDAGLGERLGLLAVGVGVVGRGRADRADDEPRRAGGLAGELDGRGGSSATASPARP